MVTKQVHAATVIFSLFKHDHSSTSLTSIFLLEHGKAISTSKLRSRRSRSSADFPLSFTLSFTQCRAKPGACSERSDEVRDCKLHKTLNTAHNANKISQQNHNLYHIYIYTPPIESHQATYTTSNLQTFSR